MAGPINNYLDDIKNDFLNLNYERYLAANPLQDNGGLGTIAGYDAGGNPDPSQFIHNKKQPKMYGSLEEMMADKNQNPGLSPEHVQQVEERPELFPGEDAQRANFEAQTASYEAAPESRVAYGPVPNTAAAPGTIGMPPPGSPLEIAGAVHNSTPFSDLNYENKVGQGIGNSINNVMDRKAKRRDSIEDDKELSNMIAAFIQQQTSGRNWGTVK